MQKQQSEKKPMTLSEVVTDICNRKTYKMPQDIRWDDLNASPYVLQRFVSMTNPKNAVLVNEISNKLGSECTKDSKFLYYCLSSFVGYTRSLRFIKRAKDDPSQIKKDEEKEKQAEKLEISKADAKYYDECICRMESGK